MSKKLKFDDDAKEKLADGMEKVCRAVQTTLGPKGNNVAIERSFGTPSVLHDGVSIAKEIELEDKFENLGASLIIEAAQKTNDVAGDGTTTATILAKAITKESLKNIAAGANPMILRKGIEKAVDVVSKRLKEISRPVKKDQEIIDVATISAQDKEIGDIIGTAIEKLGRDCVIAVEEGKSTNIQVEYKEGMEFSKGLQSPLLVTDKETGESVMEDVHILITDQKIDSMPELVSFFQKKINPLIQAKSLKSLLVIADEVSGQCLANFVLNHIQGAFKVAIVGIPGFGDQKNEVLDDMAIATGGATISSVIGSKISEMEDEDFGRATKVISTKNNTVIIGGGGDQKMIDERIEQIKAQIEKSEDDFSRERLEERLAKLTSGIAVINVGANSEAEMREKKERCIDAISATKAAISEGIVVGGELALTYASDGLDKLESDLSGDEATGVGIIREALEAPFEALMENSGYSYGRMKERVADREYPMTIDVMDGKIKDGFKSGIVDSVKVSISALQNAASIAIMVMTTNCLIVEDKKDEPQGAAQAPGIPMRV